MKSAVSQQGSWHTDDGASWWLRDAKYNEPNGDYTANCYLHVYKVDPNDVQFNDGSCSYASTDYLCQPDLVCRTPTSCRSGSAGSCKVKKVPVPGYSAGGLVHITGGRKISKSTDANSCPEGWKLWAPQSKPDWTIVYYAMKRNIKNFPQKPHIIVDVTRSSNGCGGCAKYAMKSGVSQQGSWHTDDGAPWWLRDSKYNEPNGDYTANCYLQVYKVDPNDVQFNDGSCSYSSTDYMCQPVKGTQCYKLNTLCATDSPSNCKVTPIKLQGTYSVGAISRVSNGRRLQRSTDKTSCPVGWKLWAPQSKADWTTVYNSLGKNLKNYPSKPHIIVDVTRSSNGCGGCAKYAMKSAVSQQGSWHTDDGAPWWLRDSKYNEPNGDYTANCYLQVYKVDPNDVQFNDGSCSYYATDYLCQPASVCVYPTACRAGSPGSCKIKEVNVPGYSAGGLVHITNGRKVYRSTETNSCPAGWKLWAPQNKNDWTIIYNAMSKNIKNFPQAPHIIVDVTRSSNGCGGCARYPMKSGVSQQGSWHTDDGAPWWLRDSKYNEPNGDYTANCYLQVYKVDPNNIQFNDGSCSYSSSNYLCQPVKGTSCHPQK